MFLSFKGHSGPWMTTSISSSQKKHWKTLSFWTLFLAAEFVASKAEFVTGCFVCTGSEFFPKHSVSRRREESFQLQEIRRGPLGGQARSGHTCPWAKKVYLEIVKEFGIKVKVLCFTAFWRRGCHSSFFLSVWQFPQCEQNIAKPWFS